MEPFLKMKIGDGEEFNIADKIPGLTYLGVDDAGSSPQFTNNYQDSSGKDGSYFVSQTFAKRTISEKFLLEAPTWEEFQLAKHDIYKLFAKRQIVRVRTDVNMAKVYFGYVTPFDISVAKPGAWYSNFSIPFELPQPYRYSLYRSDSPYTVEQGGWQFGMNLPKDVDLTYHFMTSTFKVYNASDIVVDPYYQNHDLKIILKFIGDSLKITNKTNNSEWQYKESGNNQQIVIDGINTTLNGENANSKTDFGNISLEPGWNDIECTGASSIDITFSFPFIYLI